MSKPIYHRPRDVDIRLLPPQLKMLIRIMGMGPALELVQSYGGTPLRVPAAVSADHWLMSAVGAVAFAALVAELRGLTIELPKYGSVARQWRHQQVFKLRQRGLTMDVIALRTGYTRRHIINILHGMAAECPQLDLFSVSTPQPSGEAQNDSHGWDAHDPFGQMARKAV